MYYVGYTNDYQRRLKEHNEQEAFNTFTSKHRPWILKAVFECGDSEAAAMKFEKYIKSQKSKKLLEQLCNKLFTPWGALAQFVRVPDVRD